MKKGKEGREGGRWIVRVKGGVWCDVMGCDVRGFLVGYMSMSTLVCCEGRVDVER